MRTGWGGASAVAATLVLSFVPAAAQDDGVPAMLADDRADAYRIPSSDAGTLEIDGRVAEAFWEHTAPVTGFRQQDPDAGDPATERTEVRIAYDDDALYVAVSAFDSRPEGVVARLLQRDRIFEADEFEGGLLPAGDDAVAILLDPFHDHRNGVVFATNPNGAEFEALLSDEGAGVNIDWRGVWEVASTRTSDGWSAEFAIPWRTLRYPDASVDRPWGLNVVRIIRRKNETVLWRSWEREGGGLERVSRAGHLVGLADLPRQGLNVEAKPYVLGGRRQEVDAVGVRTRSDELSAGLDFKTEIRPGLVLDLTYNTDFAQVEVDDAQVNLTRFSLFFPEKRDFFLENSGTFDFGVPGNPFETPAYQMFFSRRIGISDDGEVPIIGGARLTGRIGGQTVGFLNVVTDEAFGIGRETFSVARVKRDVRGSDYVGTMVVDRRGHGPTNTSAGLDAQVTVGEAWTWAAFGSRSITEGPGGEGIAYGVRSQYVGERWQLFSNHYGIEDEAEASAGFITRTDYRRSDLFAGPIWRPDGLGLRRIELAGGGQYATTVSDNRLQDWAGGGFLSMTWESSDELSIFMNAAETVVDESFELTDGVDVLPGRYRNDHIGWFGNTSTARPVSAETNGMITRFFGGSLVTVSTTLTGRISPQLSVEPGFTHNVVKVPSGSFTADISSLRTSYSFSTRLSVDALVQYNSLDADFATNIRLNYIHRPGSDLFIVFTENRGGDGFVWSRLSDRGLVMKVTYLMRL